MRQRHYVIRGFTKQTGPPHYGELRIEIIIFLIPLLNHLPLNFTLMFLNDKIEIKRHLFYETSHSPSLADIVGKDALSEVVDFCFIANPYYPDKKIANIS